LCQGKELGDEFHYLFECTEFIHDKTKKNLNSDGQHMSPISTKQKKVKTVMVNMCHQYQQNKTKLKQDGQHMSPISTKQKKVKIVMVNICHQYQQNEQSS